MAKNVVKSDVENEVLTEENTIVNTVVADEPEENAVVNNSVTEEVEEINDIVLYVERTIAKDFSGRVRKNANNEPYYNYVIPTEMNGRKSSIRFGWGKDYALHSLVESVFIDSGKDKAELKTIKTLQRLTAKSK